MYQGNERRQWMLPCFRNEDFIIISDSQFRDLAENRILRNLAWKVLWIICNLSVHWVYFLWSIKYGTCFMTFQSVYRDEHVVVIRGGSIPDIMMLLTLGFVERIGSEFSKLFNFRIFLWFLGENLHWDQVKANCALPFNCQSCGQNCIRGKHISIQLGSNDLLKREILPDFPFQNGRPSINLRKDLLEV